MKIDVLYEDNHLIAVNKPAGVLTQGDKSKDFCLMDGVKKYLKKKYKKPGNVFLGLLHRLDRPVSGIILFAKTSKGASRLSEQFRNNTIEKIYHAVVIGKPKNKKGSLINYISKDTNKNKAIISKNIKPGLPTQKAKLNYEVLASKGDYSLLKITIETGRFHQIRVQLSSIGCPILGDVKYGAPARNASPARSRYSVSGGRSDAGGPFSLPDKSIALCATFLAFFTATDENKKEISIDTPSYWKKYISF